MKRALIMLLLVVGAGAGLILWREADEPSKRQVGDSEASAPPVALIRCGQSNARALTDTVRPQADGVHLVIQNHPDDHVFYLRSAEDGGANQGGRLEKDRSTTVVTAMAPGDLFVICHRSGEDPDSSGTLDHFARVRVVDPEGLWTSPALECGEGEEAGVFRNGRIGPSNPHHPRPLAGIPRPLYPGRVIRGAVPGVRTSDRLVRPGYPRAPGHAEPRIVVRDDSVVAHLLIWQGRDHWKVMVWKRCPGSGVGGRGSDGSISRLGESAALLLR